MGEARNVLWIMADQLRWDYLSCYGHPHLHTPHLDRLAERGVRFANAYVQSPFCGPSRMSSYTGRYCRSHGVTWNGFPLRVGEPTLGDHLRDIGVRPALVGKTHMMPDIEGHGAGRARRRTRPSGTRHFAMRVRALSSATTGEHPHPKARSGPRLQRAICASAG